MKIRESELYLVKGFFPVDELTLERYVVASHIDKAISGFMAYADSSVEVVSVTLLDAGVLIPEPE